MMDEEEEDDDDVVRARCSKFEVRSSKKNFLA